METLTNAEIVQKAEGQPYWVAVLKVAPQTTIQQFVDFKKAMMKSLSVEVIDESVQPVDGGAALLIMLHVVRKASPAWYGTDFATNQAEKVSKPS